MRSSFFGKESAPLFLFLFPRECMQTKIGSRHCSFLHLLLPFPFWRRTSRSSFPLLLLLYRRASQQKGHTYIHSTYCTHSPPPSHLWHTCTGSTYVDFAVTYSSLTRYSTVDSWQGRAHTVPSGFFRKKICSNEGWQYCCSTCSVVFSSAYVSERRLEMEMCHGRLHNSFFPSNTSALP